MTTYFHRPIDFAKMLKLRFRGGDLDLLEKMKRYTSSREEEKVDAQMCPCGEAIEGRSNVLIVEECEIYKEERGVLKEEMREIDQCDMEEFATLDSSEKTIAILGGRWWPPAAKQEGDEISKKIHVMHRKTP